MKTETKSDCTKCEWFDNRKNVCSLVFARGSFSMFLIDPERHPICKDFKSKKDKNVKEYHNILILIALAAILLVLYLYILITAAIG